MFSSHCDEFIAEQAKSVIYASNRMNVPELLKVRDLLVAKYSKSILPDREIGVYPRLVLKLSMSYPEKGLCERYLEAIADNFGVDWSVDGSSSSGDEEVSDFDNQLHLNSPFPISSSSSSCHSLTANVNHSPSSATPATDTFTSTVLPSDSPPPPPYSEMKSSAPLPMDYSKQQQQQQTKQNLPDFDEFTRRFEALRKK